MAEGKKGILVYADWISKFEELTDEEAGKLIKHFFRYVNDMNPEAPDRITKLMFVDIKNTLKRNLNKYNTIKEERSYNGKLGNLKKYNIDLYNLVISKDMSLDDAEKLAKTRKMSHSDKSVAKLAVSDSDSDSVSVSDSVSDISLKEKKEKNFNEYPEDKFLSNWSNCRNHFLKEPTGFDKLNSMERIELKRALIDFTKEDIDLAMFGLFKQENITFKSMLLRPKHFLEKVDVYLTAEKTKEYKLYGSKK